MPVLPIPTMQALHQHGTVIHGHIAGDTVHRHGARNTDLGVDSDGSLIGDPLVGDAYLDAY